MTASDSKTIWLTRDPEDMREPGDVAEIWPSRPKWHTNRSPDCWDVEKGTLFVPSEIELAALPASWVAILKPGGPDAIIEIELHP